MEGEKGDRKERRGREDGIEQREEGKRAGREKLSLKGEREGRYRRGSGR